MNKYLVSAVFLSCILFVLFGCAPSIKIVSEFTAHSYSIGQVSAQSKVKLYMAGAVNVLEFNKSFDKEYASAEQFVQIVRKQAADTLKAVLGCAVAVNDNAQDAAALAGGSYEASDVQGMQELFGSSPEDFFFLIKGVDISNKVTTKTQTYMASPSGGGMFVGGGKSESCVVTIKAELWSVKEKKKILAYAAVGQSKVTMMFYGTALKAAVANAIRYMARFLKTGATQ